MLIDGDATKKAMQAGIKKLVRASKKGDVAAAALLRPRVQRAGRRRQGRSRRPRRDPVPDRSRLGRSAAGRLAAQHASTLHAGVNLTVIMDCCHSGTNTRAMLPPDAPIKIALPAEPVGPRRRGVRAQCRPGKVTGQLPLAPRRAKTKDIVVAELPEVLITGCRDTQTSADAFIDGSFNGALTFALVDAIRAAKGKLTYRELHEGAGGASRRGSSSRCRSSKRGRRTSTNRCSRSRPASASSANSCPSRSIRPAGRLAVPPSPAARRKPLGWFAWPAAGVPDRGIPRGGRGGR